MKILHVIDSGGLYGAEVMLLNLAAEQLQQGHEPIIASIGCPGEQRKPLESEALRRGIPVEPFRMKAGFNVLGGWNILKYAQNNQVDVLHSHGYKGNILLGFLPKMVRKLPIVTSVHGWTSTGRFSKMWLYECLDSQSLSFLDQVVLVNAAMKKHPKLKDRSLPLAVVNNGLPSGGLSAPGQDNTLDDEIRHFCREGFVLGAIGRLSREKGFDILLAGMQQVVSQRDDVRLVILGEGKQRAALEGLVKELGLSEKVLLPGYRPRAKDYLPWFSALVVSSLTEGLPMVVLESMQADVPIIATRVGGIPEVLDHGNAGLLVDPGDPHGLAQGILSFVRDENLRLQMAGRARHRVETCYSSQQMAEEYQRIYRRLTAGCERAAAWI